MPEAAGARNGGTKVAAPSSETIYHVRVIQAWPMEELSASASQERARYSFFGLELELTGFRADSAGSSGPPIPVASLLQFNKSTAIGNAQEESQLSSIIGPFQIRVAGKMASTAPGVSESDKLVLQKFIAVQPGNFLLEISSVRFLHTCSTGKDVLKCLLRVFAKVSMAKPFELTFQRHNHPQAAAKIVPFAMRADVQVAQVAQYKKMQEQDAQLSEVIKRKKQFITQQMDYELEHYLFDHIGMELFHLHEEIMANGQWQAYEFEQALWFYHATTFRLYAEHPMRNSAKTRQLIGTVQLKTRFAAQKLQRATRICLKGKRIADAVVDHLLLDKIWIYVWQQTWTKIWTDQFLPLHTQLLATAPHQITLEQEVERLWESWINRNLHPLKARDEAPATSKGPELADVVKNDVPSIAPRQKPLTDPTILAEDRQRVNDDVDNSPKIEQVLQSNPSEPKEIPASTEVSKSDDAESPASAEEKSPRKDNKPPDVYDDDDDDDDSLQWRGYLTLLKSNLKQKKSSPPKKHHRAQEQNETLRIRNDATVTDFSVTHSQKVVYKQSERGYDNNYLPLVAQGTGGSSNSTHLSGNTRMGSSIAPPKQGDVAPFMLSNPQYAAYDHEHVSTSLSRPVVPTHFDSLKTEERGLPAPMILKHADSFEDVDSWHRSGSFRAFHSFFARNLDDSQDANDIRIHERTAENYAAEHWNKESGVVNQHKHEQSHQPPHSQVSQKPQPSHAIDIMPSASSSSQSKTFTATEMEILLRQDRASYMSKAPVASTKSPIKLPYIVRKKKNG